MQVQYEPSRQTMTPFYALRRQSRRHYTLMSSSFAIILGRRLHIKAHFLAEKIAIRSQKSRWHGTQARPPRLRPRLFLLLRLRGQGLRSGRVRGLGRPLRMLRPRELPLLVPPGRHSHRRGVRVPRQVLL